MPGTPFLRALSSVLLTSVALLGSGCAGGRALCAADEPGAFRVRAAFDAPLNANEGWAGAINEGVAVQADRPFRVRFEVPGRTDAAGGVSHRLQYRRNGGEWHFVEAHDFPYPKTERAFMPLCTTPAPRAGQA